MTLILEEMSYCFFLMIFKMLLNIVYENIYITYIALDIPECNFCDENASLF